MKISVITINKNNKEGLERTIKSVITQTFFDKIEYIIVDGGSTDGSLDIILKYREYFKDCKSAVDSGIYNAMNKGIGMMNGDYTLFLNSGDHFHSADAVERMYNHLDCDIVYGDLCIHQANPKDGYFFKQYPDKVDAEYFVKDALPHEAAFIRSSILKRKPYREDFRIISDTIFFFESIILDGASYKHVGEVVTDFYLGGVSSFFPNVQKEKERYFMAGNLNKLRGLFV